MATDQLTLTVTCPECGESLPMRTNGRSTGQGAAEVTFDTSAVRAHIADHQPRPEPVAPGVQIISDPAIGPTTPMSSAQWDDEHATEEPPLATCRRMETRTCPAAYNGPCADRPCARFESDDETPWTTG